MALTLVGTATATGSEATLEFTGIPQTGTHLILKVLARAGSRYNRVRLNSDSTNYSQQYIGYTNYVSQVASSSYTGHLLVTTKSADTSNSFGGGEIVISNYAASSTPVVLHSTTFSFNNVDLDKDVYTTTTEYTGTQPVESVQVVCLSGNWAANSTVSLYIAS